MYTVVDSKCHINTNSTWIEKGGEFWGKISLLGKPNPFSPSRLVEEINKEIKPHHKENL
jgi:hypothetical protein